MLKNRCHVMFAAGITLMIGMFAMPEPADAQIGRRIRERAQEQVRERTERRADHAVDQVMDAAEDAVLCTVTDEQCVEAAREQGHDVVLTDQQGRPLADGPAATGTAAMRPGEGAWANYDFVPGERTIFTEDFTRDNVGDFPRRLELRRGNMEVVDWQGQRMLRILTTGEFSIPLSETLPERFTVEFDFHGHCCWIHSVQMREGREYTQLVFTPARAGLRTRGGGLDSRMPLPDEIRDSLFSVRLMVDGRHAKAYANERRIANVPNANMGRSDELIFQVGARENIPALITNIRVAAGGRPLYDALAADGRAVTRGILFDIGSDRIRPESTPTLREIGEMLRQHGDLRIRIEGHTDNVGSAELNQALSERRADAVRRHLSEQFGIAVGRLEATGRGESRPVDRNDTAEGRQNNRRVELVRLD